MKKLKLAKPKKWNKTKAKRKLDVLFSKAIRGNRGKCEVYGRVDGVRCGGPLQAAHIENRANIRLRWDVMNVLCLCFGHHFWFHRNPTRFMEFVMKYFSREYNYLVRYRNEKVTFNEVYYKEKLAELSSKVTV